MKEKLCIAKSEFAKPLGLNYQLVYIFFLFLITFIILRCNSFSITLNGIVPIGTHTPRKSSYDSVIGIFLGLFLVMLPYYLTFHIYDPISRHLFGLQVYVYSDSISIKNGIIKKKEYPFSKIKGYFLSAYKKYKRILLVMDDDNFVIISNNKISNIDEIIGSLPIKFLGFKEYSHAQKLYSDFLTAMNTDS